MSLRRYLSRLVAVAAGCATTVATAGTFAISPLRMDFAEATATAALTVRNEDATAVVVQAQGMAWGQDGGEDVLAPSRDLLISPAVFTLQPGGSQLVRVALRRKPDASRELAYRVVLQEVPQAAKPGFTGLQIALRMSLPAFVAPVAPAAPGLEWQAARGADGRLVVTAHNDGTAHARVHRFALAAATGDADPLEQTGMVYVLPGATRRWSFEEKNLRANGKTVATLAGAGRYRLQGTTDRGAFATELSLASD